MSERAFLEARAREATTATIRRIEGQTCAEVVVTLRRCSGSYRDADYLAGFILSLVTLCLLLFLPQTFAILFFPLDVTLAFLVGAVMSARTESIRRTLSSARRLEAAVRTEARAAFVDQGISGTSRRHGILVYVSLLERRLEVVPDIGVPVDTMGERWTGAVASLRAAVSSRPDLERFLAALDALGPVLATAMPRHEDDVNELSDEVGAP